MRKIIVTEFVTLDGVIEDPGGAEHSPYGGWSMDFWSDEAAQFKYSEMVECDSLLLGKTTYQGFAEAWPPRKGDDEFSDMMNDCKKYVLSRSLRSADWNNSSIVQEGDLAGLKEQDGKNILVAGSACVVRTLLWLKLVDELRLMVMPVILGGGKQLFSGLEKTALTLVDEKKMEKGVVLLTYSQNS